MTQSTYVAGHLNTEQLEAGLDHIRRSPADGGQLLMIVRRPDVDQREVLPEGDLDVDVGLVGDTWMDRGSASTPDGSSNPEAQVTVINSRALDLMAQSEDRWQLSGDQLVVDMDITMENLPAGTRLSIGSAIIEIFREAPHRLREVRRQVQVRTLSGSSAPLWGVTCACEASTPASCSRGLFARGDTVAKV